MPGLKKIVIAIIVGTSTTIVAGTMGPVCTPGSVTAPCSGSAWEFGAAALYLNRNYSTGAFTDTISKTRVVNSSLPAPAIYNDVGSADRFNTANNQWNWGFMLEGAYYFRTGNDFNLSWYHYVATSNQLLEQGDFANSIYDSPTATQFYSNVANQLKTQWDAVNLELGQRIDISDWSKMRIHGGFQYAHVQTSDNNSAASPSTAVLVLNTVWNSGSNFDQVNAFTTMKYNGFGPRVGADLFYGWDNRFAIYAKAASALFAGSRSFTSSELRVVNAAGVPNNGPLGSQRTTSSRGSDIVIVPELEAKAGLTYNHTLSQGALSIDAGWMWANYFNVLSTNGTDFEDTIGFGVQGPYVGLKWVG